MSLKLIQKLGLIGVTTAVLMIMLPATATAQTATDKPGCSTEKSLQDWDVFLSAVMSQEGFVDYWKEALGFYNTCQQQDIDAVQRRIEAIEKKIRQSYYACSYQRIEQLKTEYYKTRIELFYVRNYVYTKDGRFSLTNEAKLIEQMKTNFVVKQRYVSISKLNEYYQSFKKRYQDKPKQYQSCSQNKWSEVSKKWKELTENIENSSQRFKKTVAAKKTITKPNTTKKDNKAKVKDAAKNGASSFVGGFLEIGVNNKKISKGFSEVGAGISAEAQKIGRTPNISEATNKFFQSKEIELEKITKKEMLDRYDLIYSQAGDQAFSVVVTQMDEVNKTIKTTTPVIKKLTKCSESISSKQCK